MGVYNVDSKCYIYIYIYIYIKIVNASTKHFGARATANLEFFPEARFAVDRVCFLAQFRYTAEDARRSNFGGVQGLHA